MVALLRLGMTGKGAFVLDLLAHMLAVVSFVGGDGEWRPRCIEHVANNLTIVDLAVNA